MTAAAWFGPLNPPIKDWQGKRVWLVGASTGIGRATASALHARGAIVHVSGRTAALLDEFTLQHRGAIAQAVDASDRAQVEAAATAVMANGPLDMVIYCAGHYREIGAIEFDLDEMRKHQEINYLGALHVVKAVLPSLLAAGHGHISLLGSVAGYRGLPRSVAYGPTKAALIHLAEAMYLELRPRGLGVSIVNPGFVDTPLTARNSFQMPALISADEAALQMLRGWTRGHFEIHFPKRFTWPMKLLALLPFRIYQAIVRKGTGL